MRNGQLIGKKLMERKVIGRIKEVCLNGKKSAPPPKKQQIIRSKKQLKAKTEGQDRLSVFAVLTLLYLKLFDDK